MMDKSAALACGKDSSAVDEPASLTISGLMASKPITVGADIAHRPVIKVITVREKYVGSRVGNTTLNKTLNGFAPRFLAASTVL